MRANVECQSEIRADADGRDLLQAQDVKAWLDSIPEGATLDAIMRDFGSQRDPEVHMIGIRASWSEVRWAT